MAEPNEWMGKALHKDPVVPPDVDTGKASIARVYDYHLGGKDNLPVDREAGAAVDAVLPDARFLARDNRAFLVRAVRYLVRDAGVKQIIDIGSGLPTAGNVHEIAHAIDPEVRIVYVDNDPIVLAHGRALLAGTDTTEFITADVRQPDSLFQHPATRALVDQTQPFAVLLAGILHHLDDAEDPEGIVTAIRDRLPSGSYLMVENFYDPGAPQARELERAFLEGGLGTGRFRTREEQLRYFSGLELVDPGFVLVNEWRPDAETPTDSAVHNFHAGGVGRKP